MARILILAALLMCAFAVSMCSSFANPSSSFVTFANAAVIGIDMGSENIVLSTPGITDLEAKDYNTVEVVLNLQSHRKTANWIGFRNGERFFADDAMNLAARFPDLMTAAPHRFVGLLHNDTAVQDYMRSLHYPYTIKPHPERGTVVFEYPSGAGEGGKGASYSAEELLSMVFGHLKRTAEASTRHNEPVSAAVVTVPHFFTERQRQAVIDAAALAGLRVLSLQHPTTAAAVQYGMQNDGFGAGDAASSSSPKGSAAKPTTVAIVDMGSGATQVGIYRYGSTAASASEGGIASNNNRKRRFNVGLGDLTALSLVSSPRISGRSLDACVAKLIEDDFVEKTGLPRVLAGETAAQRKSIISLMRAAKKVKETLTANRFALYTVEGMAPEKDFSSRLTRELFEERCVSDVAAEVGKLVDRALEKAGRRLAVLELQHKQSTSSSSVDGAAVAGTEVSGALQQQANAAALEAAYAAAAPLSPSAIDRLEVIGGGPRVLRLLAELQSHTGRSVGRTMNSDEAASIGVGYRAAALSGVMRVKGFALQDTAALGQSVSFIVGPLSSASSAATVSADVAKAKPLFSGGGLEPLLPARKVISLGSLGDSGSDGAAVTFVYAMASAATAGDVRKDRVVEVSGLASALETVKYFSDFQKENNATHRVKIEVSVSESGILSVDAATVDVHYAVNITKTYKVPKKNTTDESTDASATSDDAASNEKEKKPEDGDAASAGKKKDEEPKKAEEKPKDKKKTAKDADDSDTMETKTVTTAQRRRRTFPLTVNSHFLRSPLPLSLAEARASKATLKKLDARDEAAYRLAATHNDLQSYLIWARGESFDRFRKHLTAEESEGLAKLLSETNEWVEDVATDATPRAEVRARLVAFRDAVRKLIAVAEERDAAAPAAASSSDDSDDSAFGAAPEPTAASDDFIEDDGVRRKKSKSKTVPQSKKSSTPEEAAAKKEGAADAEEPTAEAEAEAEAEEIPSEDVVEDDASQPAAEEDASEGDL